MITKEQFYNDQRFSVNKEDVDRIFKTKVSHYKICKVKLSYIKKNIKGEIIQIEQTESYQFLDDKIDCNQYRKYCQEETFEYEKHSVESFQNLIDNFDNYEIKNGAIVIDQFGLIRDGQHRASILLKKYGPKHEVEVVKIYYKGLHIKTRIKLFIKMVKDKCRKY